MVLHCMSITTSFIKPTCGKLEEIGGLTVISWEWIRSKDPENQGP